MFLKKALLACSLLSVAIIPSFANAADDSSFEKGLLTIPRVRLGDTLYNDVKLQLDFKGNSFSLVSASEGETRFKSKTNGIDEVLIDNFSTLTWVNGSHACKINADAEHTATTDAVTHCNSLDFAGYQDWRAPTSAEMSEMIIHTNRLDVKLNYRNPNCQFMATSDGFVKTENTREPGEIVESAVNSGTRCVR